MKTSSVNHGSSKAVVQAKEAYVKYVKISSKTYECQEGMESRFKAIFGTFARVLSGRHAISKKAKHAEMIRMSAFLRRRVVESKAANTTSQNAYDRWHRKMLERLRNECPIRWSGHKKLTIGMCQKMVNLVMKDLWALDKIGDAASSFLHIVLDAQTLAFLNDGLAVASIPWTRIDSYEEYFRLQQVYRELRHPLLLEQAVWRAYA